MLFITAYEMQLLGVFFKLSLLSNLKVNPKDAPKIFWSLTF